MLQSDWSTQPDSHVMVAGCPTTFLLFFKMAPYRTAVMNDDIAKFRHDSMQEITKKQNL